jgi:hypothetical protein
VVQCDDVMVRELPAKMPAYEASGAGNNDLHSLLSFRR